MIFLLLEMFIYLLLAGVIGAGSGWLLRNLQAQKMEEAANRAAHDAKAKLPQLESMVRGRDEQLAKLKTQLNDTKKDMKQQQNQVRQLEQQLREQTREAKRWQQSAQARQSHGTSELELLDGMGDVEQDSRQTTQLADESASALQQQVTRLRLQMADMVEEKNTLQKRLESAQAQQDSSEESVLQIELDAARAEVVQLRRRLEEAAQALQEEQTKVVELQREQELQNKSLTVLHQQLEMERVRRTANG